MPSLFDSNQCQFCIPIASTSVSFLHSPEQFYQELLKRISTSNNRVVLAALYLGTGQKEKEIVSRIQSSIHSNENLQVNFLLDYFRGTRGGTNSSRALLSQLSTNKNVQISFFHTPEMRGFIKSLLPERINEIIGLQHMKFFIFDDSILISGANLSEQYFVDRQDRYLLIENCPLLADFFCSIYEIIAKHSMRIDSAGKELEFYGDPSLHPFTGLHSEIQKSIKIEIDKLYEDYRQRLSNELNSTTAISEVPKDTFVFPFLQMGSFKIDHEIELLSQLFNNNNGEDLEVTLMTAYFNLYDIYADLILRKCTFPITIVFGSPKTNGFFGANGPSGQIPALYVQNAVDFMKRMTDAGRENIQFKEWERPDWTFHAKGLWAFSKTKNKWATIVGSSNYGYRSAHRDLEAQILLVTENEALKRNIIEERNFLLDHAETLDVQTFLRRNHFIPTWVKYFSRFFRHYF